MLAVLFLFAAVGLGFASGFARWFFALAIVAALVSGWFFATGDHGLDVAAQAHDGALPGRLAVAFADGLPVAALAFAARLLSQFLVWVSD